MPKYNFLPNNKSEFPHIGNVDTYKYDNNLDYGRFDYTQMSLQICTVPWDMGEAHIGNRTISGIGNVVYFGSKEKRDAWFDAIPDDECYRFNTKFKELHRQLYIDVPVPFDMCAKHNYLVVEYNKFANDDSPLQYEGDTGVRKWFWFIREVEFMAPNTTRLHILDDAFQTWIYDVNVSGMVLERGHAPMFATDAATYLSNPLANNDYLLTEDVNFGEATQVKHIDALALNAGTMYACIATTATPVGNWTDKAPAEPSYTNNGQPSVYVFAMMATDLNSFLNNITANVPQFKQTVQGVFFASSDLITLSNSFSFGGVTCYGVSSTRKTFDLCELNKNLFGYDAKYADIAKLYTAPYAHIEITDENGNVDVVKIEDTTGNIDVNAALSIAYPFITIDAHLMGVGGNASASVTYRNIDAHTFNISGQWYETLRSWNVPTFAVVLDASREYDYSTRFDRAQRVVDYTAAYNNEIASAAAAQGNENASAATLNANAALTAAANTATTARSNQSANTTSSNTQTYNSGVANADNVLVAGSASSTIAANEQQGNISAASGMTQSAVNAVGAAASGNIAGAITGVVNGAIGGVATIASTAVANGLTATQAGFTQAGNSAHATASNTKTTWDVDNQTNTASDLTVIQNNLTEGTTANSAATQIANAARTYAAASGNAARTQSAAQSAIDNDIAQAALRAPFVYGSFSNGDGAANKPIALFAHIVTQSKSAISSAGDEMLRYGYHFDKQWDFNGNWNIGRYFTYWKLRDFWVSDLNVPDMYMDKLRFFLFGGVTVWRNPADIGKRTVYENYNG